MPTDRNVKVRLTADPSGFIAGMRAASAAVSDIRKNIDKTNDRTAWLAQSFLALGPSLAPIGAAAVPALAGIATQMVVTGLAAGTMVLAFNGVGDALKALNDFQMAPTAEHLAKLHQTMDKIGPSGQHMVFVLDEMGDTLSHLADVSRGKMFPGVIDGLYEIQGLAPQVEKIVGRVSHTIGELSADAGEGLAGPKFEEFFDFLKTDAISILRDMGRTLGNVVDGLAAMLVAFVPLSNSFSGGMLEMSQSFSEWAHGLEDNDSFQSFIAYIQENTPRVLDFLGQLVDTFVAIVEAAAPVGAVMLPLFTGLLNIVEALANTPLGPIFIAAAAAMSLYGRAAALASITTGGLGKQVGNLALGIGGLSREFDRNIAVMGKHRAALDSDAAAVGRHSTKFKAAASGNTSAIGRWSKALAPAGVTAGAFAFALSPLPEKLGLTNTAMGAMTGALAGPWGAAVGAGVGLVLDLAKSTDVAVVAAEDLVDAIDLQTLAVGAQGYADVGEALAGIADNAATAGISFEDVITAAVEGGDAYENLGHRIDDVIAADTTYSSTGVAIYGEKAQAASAVADALFHQNGETKKAIDLARGRKAGIDAATDAERDHAHAADDTRFSLDDLSTATDTNKDGVIDQTDAILDNIAAMDERTDAINSAFDAETAYQRSLQVGADREKAAAEIRKQIADVESGGAQERADLRGRLADAKTPAERKSIQDQIADSFARQAETLAHLREQLAEYAPTLDKTTKAGQANRDVLSDMAAGWNNLSDKQQNAKGKFEQARKALIDQAMQFGATRKEAKGYADRLLEIPPKVATKILLDKQRAQAQLDEYATIFRGLDGKIAKTVLKLKIDRVDQMAGGTQGFRLGGWTGNAPVNQPAGIVHGREFVVPAPYAERDRGALEARYLKGYRSGGYVEPARMAPSAQTLTAVLDRDDLASLVGSGAPYIGHAVFNSNGDSERAERRARRLRGAGGRST